MKWQLRFLFAGLMGLALLQACVEECDVSLDDTVGGQFFSVEYRTPAGANYLQSIYNLSNVIVFLDTTGGKDPVPRYELISPGFKEGVFGPYFYTSRYVVAETGQPNTVRLYGIPYRFDYYIKKDSYGQDTISVEFLMEVDKCNHFWKSIKYYRNGDLLPEFTDQEQAAIVIVE
mgnify:CR=1 FL=1